ncbi:hypothetical protein JCM10049v2_001142 [Rhodotorula toruloides]
MATAASLRARKDQIVEQYRDHADLVRDVQKQALAEVLPSLRDEFALDEDAVAAGTALLEDRVTVFRFCRRARFSPTAALKLLHATCHWRLTSHLRHLSPASIHSIYLTKPLFFFHPSLVDRFGRPCAVLNLKYVQRTEDGRLDALKEFVRLGWEVGRRYLSDMSRRAGDDQDPKLQMVVIVDLDGAGMSNLEVELLPFFLDLLKNHFPGMVGAIFVLNYGWAYAGMWQLAKRVLPNTALERILFPSKEELLEFFDEDHLLVEHGGNVKYDYTPANPILDKYGRLPHLTTSTASSAYPSPGPTPSASSASLHGEVFHSAPPSRPITPAMSRRQSGLVMTAASSKAESSGSSGWFGFGRRPPPQSEGSPSGLRRVRSLAELHKKLEQTQREIDDDDSLSEEQSEYGAGDGGSADGEQGESFGPDSSRGPSTVASGRSSRFSSRAGSRVQSRTVSRSVSREASPSRRRSVEPLTTAGGGGVGDMHMMSPYNASNPHFGYPAYVPPSSLDPYGIPRPHHYRRRKRDLVRTLTYLAALRFLALHRAIQYRLNLIVAMLFRITGLGWWQARKARAKALEAARAAGGAGPVPDKKVHWVASNDGSPASSNSSSSTSIASIVPPAPHEHHHSHAHPSAVAIPAQSSYFIDIDPSIFYLSVLFLIIRTPRRREKLKALCRFLAVGAPSWTLAKGREGALMALLGREKARTLLEQERVARGA